MLSTRAVHHTGRITHLLLGQLHATSPRTSHKASCLTLSHGHSRAIYQIVADGGKIPPMKIDCCKSTNLQQSCLLCYGSTQLGLVLHPLMLTATEPTNPGRRTSAQAQRAKVPSTLTQLQARADSCAMHPTLLLLSAAATHPTTPTPLHHSPAPAPV